MDGNVTDRNLLGYRVTVDGENLTTDLPHDLDTYDLSDGNHTLTLHAKDKAGNANSTSVAFTVDNTVPELSLDRPLDGAFLNDVATVSFSAADRFLNEVRLFVDGNLVATSTSPDGEFELNTTRYDEGPHNLTVAAVDEAGNVNRTSARVVFDNTPPRLDVTEMTPAPVANRSFSLLVETERNASVAVNGENVSLTNGTGAFTENISSGRVRYVVEARDRAGNLRTWNETYLVDHDTLPARYEINVTKTDPLDSDSDSPETLENEAGNGVPDGQEDFDNDGLDTATEFGLGTDPFNRDTDGDGLTDGFEAEELGLVTDPAKMRTDGTLDSEKDIDGDNLTNIQEQESRTQPLINDTDGDGLSDGRELEVGSDPLEKDTDKDGLTDSSELRLGTSPTQPDTDGDGVPDGSETYLGQKIETGVAEITATAEGDFEKNTYVEEAKDSFSNRVGGSIDQTIDVHTYSEVDEAKVRIRYNESRLGNASEEDLRLYHLNETTHEIEFLDDQRVAAGENYVEGSTTHFSTISVLDYSDFQDMWSSGQDPVEVEYTSGEEIEIGAVIRNVEEKDVTRDVTVHFYEGDPENGGTLIGKDTIEGGIRGGGQEKAVYRGYTVPTSPVKIFVEVDPNDEIDESEERLNNIAYREFGDADTLDSDGDGISNYDEKYGMRTPFGIYRTDPHDPDTDGDGLMDGEEMGHTYLSYYRFNSDPTRVDTDGDGLDDYEEERVWDEAEVLEPDTDGDGLTDFTDPDIQVENTVPTIRNIESENFYDYVVFEVEDERGSEIDVNVTPRFDTVFDTYWDSSKADVKRINHETEGDTQISTYKVDFGTAWTGKKPGRYWINASDGYNERSGLVRVEDEGSISLSASGLAVGGMAASTVEGTGVVGGTAVSISLTTAAAATAAAAVVAGVGLYGSNRFATADGQTFTEQQLATALAAQYPVGETALNQPVKLPSGYGSSKYDPRIGDYAYRGYGWKYIKLILPGLTQGEIGDVLKTPNAVYDEGDAKFVIGDNPEGIGNIVFRLPSYEGSNELQIGEVYTGVPDYASNNIDIDEGVRKILNKDDWDHNQLGNSKNEISRNLQRILRNPSEVYGGVRANDGVVVRVYVKEMFLNGNEVVVFALVVDNKLITSFVPAGEAPAGSTYENVYDRQKAIEYIVEDVLKRVTGSSPIKKIEGFEKVIGSINEGDLV